MPPEVVLGRLEIHLAACQGTAGADDPRGKRKGTGNARNMREWGRPVEKKPRNARLHTLENLYLNEGMFLIKQVQDKLLHAF